MRILNTTKNVTYTNNSSQTTEPTPPLVKSIKSIYNCMNLTHFINKFRTDNELENTNIILEKNTTKEIIVVIGIIQTLTRLYNDYTKIQYSSNQKAQATDAVKRKSTEV